MVWVDIYLGFWDSSSSFMSIIVFQLCFLCLVTPASALAYGKVSSVSVHPVSTPSIGAGSNEWMVTWGWFSKAGGWLGIKHLRKQYGPNQGVQDPLTGVRGEFSQGLKPEASEIQQECTSVVWGLKLKSQTLTLLLAVWGWVREITLGSCVSLMLWGSITDLQTSSLGCLFSSEIR